MSTVKEESKKLNLDYAMTGALDATAIASEANKVYITNKQSEERLQSFEKQLGDAQVSLISLYTRAILNRTHRESQLT